MGLLTAKQVAQMLNIPDQRVRRMAREGQIECVQIGPRTRRFRAEAVTAFVERRSNGNPIGEVADVLGCDECCEQSEHRTWCPSRKEARHADP